eukprot:SAG11_NODE_32986_length_276_cov_1.783333_1_plen_41_part_10
MPYPWFVSSRTDGESPSCGRLESKDGINPSQNGRATPLPMA